MASGGAPPWRAGRTRVTLALRAWAGAGGGGGRSWAGGSGGRGGGGGGGGGSDSAVLRGQPGHRSASSPLPRPSGTLPLAARRAAGAARPWPRSPARCPGPSTRMTTSCRRSSVSGHWGAGGCRVPLGCGSVSPLREGGSDPLQLKGILSHTAQRSGTVWLPPPSAM